MKLCIGKKVKIRVLIMETMVNFCGKNNAANVLFGIDGVAKRKANGRLDDIFSEKDRES